ncbi:MAG: acetolactate synthase small subunit [Magnetococcales bacterium]|nr:acetolactate synthase small subunit [Magnetococcales bacterium]
MRHVISVLVENEVGVLARVAGLFSARGFNIESLTVAPMPTVASFQAEEGMKNVSGCSRITLVTHGDDGIIEQIIKQLNKLIPVTRVVDVTDGSHVEREMMLVKLNAEREVRNEALRIAEIFRAHVVDVGPTSLIIEITGKGEKLNACLTALAPYRIVDVVRTGQVAMLREPEKV